MTPFSHLHNKQGYPNSHSEHLLKGQEDLCPTHTTLVWFHFETESKMVIKTIARLGEHFRECWTYYHHPLLHNSGFALNRLPPLPFSFPIFLYRCHGSPICGLTLMSVTIHTPVLSGGNTIRRSLRDWEGQRCTFISEQSGLCFVFLQWRDMKTYRRWEKLKINLLSKILHFRTFKPCRIFFFLATIILTFELLALYFYYFCVQSTTHI